MPNSPLVSIRIPPETLERIDQLAQKLYPPRRAGKTPNRSQVILDAIHLFLEQHEASCVETPILAESIEHERVNGSLQIEPVDEEHRHTEQQLCPEPLPEDSQQSEPPVRDYIDWWFNYFSYMKKFSDTWFKSR